MCSGCGDHWNPSIPQRTNDHLWSYSYADPIARQLICAWKYDFDASARDALYNKLHGRLSVLVQLVEAVKIQAIVPIPLHHRRLCERGFDQSADLARYISGVVGTPVLHALTRRRFTGSQVDRMHTDRRVAMQDNPFCAQRVLPDRVLLVDDVWTTGATSSAAKQALEANGVKHIWTYTVAKG